MWSMKKMEKPREGTQVVQVSARPLDKVLGQIPETIYFMKVDTQGFEPHVFSGLNQMLSQHKIQYILTEFWPRGIDILQGSTDRECTGVSLVLQKLVEHGYTLYALSVEAHPKAPAYKNIPRIQSSRPFDDLFKHCQWYYEVEDQYPDPKYKMGYWTDFLALAPNVELPRSLSSLLSS